MLKVDNLYLRDGAFELTADFEVAAGARMAIIGPSGAGKSTLLMMIAGYLKPDSGTVLWNGEDITGWPPGRRPISMLFQDNNLFPHLTAAQNVALGIKPNMRLSVQQKASVDAALSRVGLADMGGRKPSQLSGGQQSRVTLARVLVQRRALILLDEPFAALGPAMRQDMLGLLSALADSTEATLLMVSHSPADARLIASQTIVVMDGKVSQPRDTAELFENPDSLLKQYLGEG